MCSGKEFLPVMPKTTALRATPSSVQVPQAGHGPVPDQARHASRLVQQTTAKAPGRLGTTDQPVPDPARPPGVCAAHDGTPDSLQAWLGQPLAINYLPAGRSPLEGLVPRPKQPLSGPDLEDDNWLAVDCKKPEFLETFNALLQERRSVEARHGEFCFAPLTTTLRNMQIFIGHILEGRQFHDPLRAQEREALVWATARTEALLQAGVPYKKTVFLTVAFLTLCEIMTDRQVLGPVHEGLPEACRRRLSRVEWRPPHAAGLIHCGPPDETLYGASLDPGMVAALSWGGNNPAGASETGALFAAHVHPAVWFTLSGMVNDDQLLIYPSFQALGIADFCDFGHLAMHPVGMLTEHALNADGEMMSPLEFAIHDMQHMSGMGIIGDPDCQETTDGMDVWRRSDRRLGWRCLLLDQIPPRLAGLNLKPALQLLLFQMFHEFGPKVFPQRLQDQEGQGFFACVHELADVRRIKQAGYPADCRAITDREAAVAALWTVHVFDYWKGAQYQRLTAAALDSCAHACVDHALPILDRHLDFIRHNRAALRGLFADPAHCRLAIDKEGVAEWSCLPEFEGMQGGVLFATMHWRSGLQHLDYTDIAYFSALRSAPLYQKMADRFGARLPPRLFS